MKNRTNMDLDVLDAVIPFVGYFVKSTVDFTAPVKRIVKLKVNI